MTPQEQTEFLNGAHAASLTSIGPDGYPHTTGMWYAVIDGMLHFATYRKSQKVRNFQRNQKASALIQTGDQYENLRGLLVQGDAEILQDPELAGDVMLMLSERYVGLNAGLVGPNVVQQIRERGAKRAVVRIRPVRITSWDHTKLSGGY